MSPISFSLFAPETFKPSSIPLPFVAFCPPLLVLANAVVRQFLLPSSSSPAHCRFSVLFGFYSKPEEVVVIAKPEGGQGGTTPELFMTPHDGIPQVELASSPFLRTTNTGDDVWGKTKTHWEVSGAARAG